MKEFNTGAKKDVKGKLPYHLIPKEGMDAIASGLECGVLKGYPAWNWSSGLPIMECHLAPALRHIFKYMNGENENIEEGPNGEIITTHHLDNALAHLIMAATQIRRGRADLDDRPTR
jgi:hypothetical protein